MAREKVVIIHCPYNENLGEIYRTGAKFTMPEFMDIVFDKGMPNGTDFLYCGVTYRLYKSRYDTAQIRYVLTDDEKMLEDTAMYLIRNKTTNYIPRWAAIS